MKINNKKAGCFSEGGRIARGEIQGEKQGQAGTET